MLASAGCQAADTTYSVADLDAAEAEVAATLNEFWSGWESADFDEGLTYFSESPDMTFITDGSLWKSWEAVVEAHRPYFETIERQEIDLAETGLNAVAPEAVYVTQTGTYRQFDQATYDRIHELEVYQDTPQELLDVFAPVAAMQRYSRYLRVPTGGPGEG
jgi:hypothetical protein